jgi:hypothetical protein
MLASACFQFNWNGSLPLGWWAAAAAWPLMELLNRHLDYCNIFIISRSLSKNENQIECLFVTCDDVTGKCSSREISRSILGTFIDDHRVSSISGVSKNNLTRVRQLQFSSIAAFMIFFMLETHKSNFNKDSRRENEMKREMRWTCDESKFLIRYDVMKGSLGWEFLHIFEFFSNGKQKKNLKVTA